MTKEFITNSAEETQDVGRELANQFVRRSVVCLYGDLGFGKTTFVQGMAKGLGIEHRIISPTFVIVRKYNVKYPISNIQYQIKNTQNLYHIDLYRMQSLHDLEGLGIREILEDPDSIVLIEWPEKLGELLPEKRIDVKFEYLDEEQRKLTVEYKK